MTDTFQSGDRFALISNRDVDVIKRWLKSTGTSNEAMQVIKRLEDTFAAYEPDTVQRAADEYERGGEIEIDPGAVVSRGDDDGAYVMAWVWVGDEQ